LPLPLAIALVAVLTAALFLGVTAAVPRLLRVGGKTGAIVVELASSVVRLALAALLAFALALAPARLVEHKLALVLAVGATYFAVACLDAVRRLRARSGSDQEVRTCSAR